MAGINKILNLDGLKYFFNKFDKKKADVNSPIFTGIPTVPTPDGSINLQVANTEFVKNYFDNNALPSYEGELEILSEYDGEFEISDEDSIIIYNGAFEMFNDDGEFEETEVFYVKGSR